MTDNTSNIKSGRKKNFVLLLYSLASAVLLLYLTEFSAVPVLDILGILAFALFSVIYSVLLASSNVILCLIAPGVSIGVITASAIMGKPPIICLLAFSNLFFAIAVAVCMHLCAAKKASKSVTFAALTGVYTCNILSTALFFVYDIYKSVGLSTIKIAVNDICAYLESTIDNAVEMVKAVYGVAGATEAAMEDMGSAMSSLTDSFVMSFRLNMPSLFIIYAMLFASITVLIYKMAVKLCDMTDKCLNNRNWVFGLSKISAIFFEVVFVVYFLSILFAPSSSIFVAFMNLLSILSYPFGYIGIKRFARFLEKKMKTSAGGIAVAIFLFAVMSMLMGSTVLMLFAFFGSSYTIRENK